MHGVIEPLSKLGVTGEGEDSPQSSEKVAGQVGKQRVQIIWREETLKKQGQRNSSLSVYRKGLWGKISILLLRKGQHEWVPL